MRIHPNKHCHQQTVDLMILTKLDNKTSYYKNYQHKWMNYHSQTEQLDQNPKDGLQPDNYSLHFAEVQHQYQGLEMYQ